MAHVVARPVSTLDATTCVSFSVGGVKEDVELSRGEMGISFFMLAKALPEGFSGSHISFLFDRIP